MAATIDSAGCEWCIRDDGNYFFGCAQCCARFVTSLHFVSARRFWMERLKARVPIEFYAEVEREVRERWERLKGAQGKT